MFEIELKASIRRERLDDLRKRITELGGTRIGVFRQVDVYLNHPCRDFAKTDEALRIRDHNGKVELTYKGARVHEDCKCRVEKTIEVKSSINDMLEFLSYLGFSKVFEIVKNREIYSVNRKGYMINICLDDVLDLGFFVEVELFSAENAINESINVLKSVLRDLGLTGPYITKSYLEILLDKRGENESFNIV